MDPYLISITVRERVGTTPDDILRLRLAMQEGTHRAVLLGRKGSMHFVTDPEQFSAEQLTKAAREGLLYTEAIGGRPLWAFAAGLDAASGMPRLLDEYQEAFRRRQLDNRPPDKQINIYQAAQQG